MADKTELVIIRGLPGSGKSTWAREHLPEHILFEPDHLFCDVLGRYVFEAQLWDEAVRFVLHSVDCALMRGHRVAVADVFSTRAEIAPFHDVARHHGAGFRIIERCGGYRSIHGVPLCIIERMRSKWEAISPCEVV